MKRLFWVLGGLIIITVFSAYVYRDMVVLMIFRAYVKPPSTFAEMAHPATPDYFNPEHWAALPDRVDGADFTPAGFSDGQASAGVDVFFVHPTTYLDSAGWNAPMGDKDSGKWVDGAVMTGQASTFNGAARVYAPRYRQAQIYAFFALEDGGYDALELAYSDVQSAFDHYMAEYNRGRPFILAGHSQGALLTQWLLERRITGTALLNQVVAAYPIGYFMNAAELTVSIPDIPVCQSPAQTGCLVTWNTTGDGYHLLQSTAGMVCVNPLTWTSDDVQGDFDNNDGALSTVTKTVLAGVADARCDNGKLHVSEIRTDVYDYLPNMGKGNHHLLDYALYWSNIRNNVAERVAAYEDANTTKNSRSQ